MSGRKSFSTLAERMSPESQKRAQMKADLLSEEMNLAELRRARDLSQEEIAEVLHVGQAAVAKLERRTDMYLSTLRRFLSAMGAELEISARFPDRVVRIHTFEGIKGPSVVKEADVQSAA
jgi:transcriptional regulator with XRE-family HTH domain